MRTSNITEVHTILQPGAVTGTVNVIAEQPAMMNTSSSSVSNIRLGDSINLLTKSGSSQQLSTPRLREYFPETLVWQPSIETDTKGRAKLNFKLADNITTWKMAVIASTEDGRIGTVEKEFKAFQPFFVEHDPPRVLTEGDEISLPVVVRNYLERTQQVDLEIKPEQWFTLLGPARRQTKVAAGDGVRATFDLRATASVKDGKQRIVANSSEDNDAIEKPVTVHPDGEEVSVTASDIVSSSATLEINVPEATIPGSTRGELKIYPNLMAHLIESVEAIMERPHGCGEQTISSTYPSLFLVRYFKQTGNDFSPRAKAQRYLTEGYGRLLNYREAGGGFSYWGRGTSDLALTAYALRFLSDARGLIAVDENVINETRNWLIKQQRADGSWSRDKALTGTEDRHSTAIVSAYVARVLAMTETDRAEPSDALKRALDYLSQRAREIDEPYLLASLALAAIDAHDSARAKLLIDKLRSLSLKEGGTTYWSLNTNTPFHGWGLSGQVETTALVVQALARYQSSSDSRLIDSAMFYLLKQKDRYGVWYSTQATVNVLDSMLALLSQNIQSQNSQSAAEILVDGRPVQTIQMPVSGLASGPIIVDISQFLQTGRNGIQIRRPAGSPQASVQAVANYYVPWSTSESESTGLRVMAKFDKTEGKINDPISCHVEVERAGGRGHGMMLAEIGLPPGADVDRASLEAAMKNSGWSINRYDVLPDRVIFYLWPPAAGIQFDFSFHPRLGVNAKAAPSLVYDYYNPEARAVAAPARFRIK